MPQAGAVSDDLSDLAIPVPPLFGRAGSVGVFTRVITTPAGAPWEQARIAELDARLGAPMPVSSLAIRLIRILPWRPGAEGRFAIFYARADRVRGGLRVQQQVEGRTLNVAFRSAAERAAGLRRLMAIAILAAGAAAIIGGAAVKSLATRADLQDRLGRDARLAAAAARNSRVILRQGQIAKEVRAAGLQGRTVADLLTAMAAAGDHRRPQAQITAFHWDHGYVAVETLDGASPLQDGAVVGRQGKNGAWFWGIGSTSADGERR